MMIMAVFFSVLVLGAALIYRSHRREIVTIQRAFDNSWIKVTRRNGEGVKLFNVGARSTVWVTEDGIEVDPTLLWLIEISETRSEYLKKIARIQSNESP